MNINRLTKVIVAPCVSEKSTLIQSDRQYVFRVQRCATKYEITQAVKALFGVDVETVRLMNVKGKKRKFRNIEGKLRDWKKAYVKVKEGQLINLGGGV